jgi:multicomponent Na+:H+ antiporter subunit B
MPKMNNENRKIKHVITSCGCDFLIPLTLVLLFDIILHGHLSPGGGFQGGVLMVAVFTLIYLGYGYDSIKTIKGGILHDSEGIASSFDVVFAMLGVVYGGYFCENILFRSGNIGDLWSSGTIFLMNAAVGAKVLTGVGMLALYMLAILSQIRKDS